jgi:hypothetical protein
LPIAKSERASGIEAEADPGLVKPWSTSVRVAIVAGSMLAAAVHASAADEIQHLLDYVGGSGCTFVRNGVESDGAAAREHLATKYGYVKNRARSAEEFIRLAASRSSMTGEPYAVICGSARFLSEDWLMDELRRYRKDGP